MSQIQSFSRLSAILTMDNSQFLRGTEVASMKLAKFSRQATIAGQTITRSLTVAFALVGSAAIKTAADYDKTNAALEAIVGGGAIKGLVKQSKELGRTSIFTASQIAVTQKELAKLGLKEAEIKAVTKQATALAQVFDTDLNDAAKAATITMNQFGLGAEDVGRIIDVMTYAFTNSALDVEKWTHAMSYAGVVARATGTDLETTAAALAIAADNGIEGSMAGTALRKVLQDLGPVYGDLNSILDAVNAGMLDSQLENYANSQDLVGRRAATLLYTLAGQRDEVKRLAGEMREAKGITEKLADVFKNRLADDLAKGKAALESIAITVGEALAPLFKEMVKFLQDVARRLAQMDPKTIEKIARIVFQIAKMGAFLMIAGQVMSLVNALYGLSQSFLKNVVPAFRKFNRLKMLVRFRNLGTSVASLAARFGPLGLAVAGVTLTVAALYDAWQNSGTAADRAARSMKGYNEALAEAAAEAAATKSEVEFLINQFKLTDDLEQQGRILDELARKYPDYFEEFEKGKTKVEDLEDAMNDLIKAQKESARLAAIEAALAPKREEMVKAQTALLIKQAEGVEKGYGTIEDGKFVPAGGMTEMMPAEFGPDGYKPAVQTAYGNYMSDLRQLQSQANLTKNTFEELFETLNQLNQDGEGSSSGTKTSKTSTPTVTPTARQLPEGCL
jgi:ribosomal protein S17E